MTSATAMRVGLSATLLTVLFGLLACARVAPNAPALLPAKQVPTASDDAADPPRTPGRPLIIIAMPDSRAFQQVRRSLIAEIGKTYNIQTYKVSRNTRLEDFAAQMDQSDAVCAVLMDNPTVNLFRAYERLPLKRPSLPALVVMSTFLEEIGSQLKNATGVAYEVPGVTAFVSLRSLVIRPVQRIGVIHRPNFKRFVDHQQRLASNEQFTVVPVVVPADPSPVDVRAALAKLGRAKIDALWILNDNRLLRDGEFLEGGWRQGVEALNVPVIVGVPSMVGVPARLGTMAVLPDLEEMGDQAAKLLLEFADNGFRANGLPIEQPLSTLTFVDLGELRKLSTLRDGAIERIDRQVD